MWFTFFLFGCMFMRERKRGHTLHLILNLADDMDDFIVNCALHSRQKISLNAEILHRPSQTGTKSQQMS